MSKTLKLPLRIGGIRLAILSLFALSAVDARAQVPLQFNLTCTGSMFRKFDGQSTGPAPFVTSMRVDLPKNLWCVDQCDSPNPINRISDTELLLQQSREPDMDVYISLNRRSGELSQAISIHPTGGNGKVMEMTVFATCKRSPFVPMPEKQF